ncbi:16S rRNA (guanine(527)-N(7))-methyltransferase RsmG [candidate division KSB1 bacterium]|nr:16S rRNA (guanine(527)-N(7))-methyltransferase RsmG [candidate division KSB1 bacterium]NIR72465.1 16S rRNA (guanine(527)-N(7))-methyltransferase RsmG [candidate division KSB1 bacterium]NIS24050.1 16S rRNA (guanine(527)-N(7))-methyltransferase RsmG [candidate division KSB1 bacterium]NIT70969.1 16S rRNA (guanine(527)-N(7))-methyltransferase RsmG [candidate division KSB1 bacterium]NIU27380.1 16S rRNA (guanine(527)-N(7))-methyltransferase RsmG [candidate division KSB1 bacterium]
MKQRLHEHFAQAGIQLSELQSERFLLYHQELLSWNRRTNLISKNDEARIVQRHFLESALLSLFQILQGDVSVIDIGTGAGFPGLPLKIVQPAMSLTLLDSKRMKTLFLKSLIRKMNLSNIELVCERAEIAGKNQAFKHRFDVAMSRAVTSLSKLHEFASPFLKSGGTLVAIKGSNLGTEIATFEKSYPALSVSTKALPRSSSGRNQVAVFVSKAPLHQSRLAV